MFFNCNNSISGWLLFELRVWTSLMNHHSHHSLATVWRNTWWTNRPKIGTFLCQINPCCWEFCFHSLLFYGAFAKQFAKKLNANKPMLLGIKFSPSDVLHEFSKKIALFCRIVWHFWFQGNILFGLQTYCNNFLEDFSGMLIVREHGLAFPGRRFIRWSLILG